MRYIVRVDQQGDTAVGRWGNGGVTIMAAYLSRSSIKVEPGDPGSRKSQRRSFGRRGWLPRVGHAFTRDGVGALNKIVARLRGDGRAVDVVGFNRTSADIVDRFARHDKTGVEMGLPPH